jgi:hypothetical protein
MRTESWFCKKKKFVEVDDGDGCTTKGMYVVPLSCTLKNNEDIGCGGSRL